MKIIKASQTPLYRKGSCSKLWQKSPLGINGLTAMHTNLFITGFIIAWLLDITGYFIDEHLKHKNVDYIQKLSFMVIFFI